MKLETTERFRKGPHAAKHSDLVVSESFRVAAETAMIAYQNDLAVNVSPEESARNYHKLVGAREFLYTFMNLTETPIKNVSPSVNRLRHDV